MHVQQERLAGLERLLAGKAGGDGVAAPTKRLTAAAF
jgi:hypothetical protein